MGPFLQPALVEFAPNGKRFNGRTGSTWQSPRTNSRTGASERLCRCSSTRRRSWAWSTSLPVWTRATSTTMSSGTFCFWGFNLCLLSTSIFLRHSPRCLLPIYHLNIHKSIVMLHTMYTFLFSTDRSARLYQLEIVVLLRY